MQHLIEESDYQAGTWCEVTRGMLEYRCGDYQNALRHLSQENLPFQTSLALLFSAMTHQRIGQPEKASQLLIQARNRIKLEMPTYDGPELSKGFEIPDRPIAWCMLQIVVREAEQLITPAGTLQNEGVAP